MTWLLLLWWPADAEQESPLDDKRTFTPDENQELGHCHGESSLDDGHTCTPDVKQGDARYDFEQFDADGDGHITMKELRAI